MSEMIERATMAVFKAHAEKTAAFKRNNPGTLVADVPLTHEEMVIATLLAIREPTEAMLNAWASAPKEDEWRSQAAGDWQAMIDAALE